jgi:hypothetical protein
MIVLRAHDLLFQAYSDRFIVKGHSGGIQGKKASLKYGTLKFVANFCRVSRVVEETRNHYMSNRPVFALFIMTLLGFPVALFVVGTTTRSK